MPQVLKDEVQSRIAAAAIEVFARHGYAPATMAEIAASARISTGNVYRYYADKETLFHAVVDDGFVRRFTALLERRVHALDGVDDDATLAADSLYHLASEELLRFCIDNRLRVVILLGRCAGSRHERFAEKTVDRLIDLAIAHFRAADPSLRVAASMRVGLVEIYRNFVGTMVRVLAQSDDEATIRARVGDYTRYHLAGLKYFFEGAGASAGAAKKTERRRDGGKRRKKT